MINPAKTQAAAARLQMVVTGGLVVLLVLAAAGLVQVARSPLAVGDFLAQQAGYGEVPLSPLQAWGIIAIVAVHVMLWACLLMLARKLFRHMVLASPTEVARCARKAGYVLWIMVFWGIASQGLASVTSTRGYQEGQRVLSICIGMPQVSLAFSALMAGFMAHAFTLGAALWEDHREVI